MKTLKAQNHLVKDGPDIILLCELLCLFCLVYLALEITIITVLHDNTEGVGLLFEKGLFVTSNIGMPNGGQDSHFIQSILLFFF